MAEKTEKPTRKKRKDSAKKGQSFKSKDLITTITLLTSSVYLNNVLSLNSFTNFYAIILTQSKLPEVNVFIYELLCIFIRIILPFVVLCFFSGFATTLLQTKCVIATDAIKVNFKALNPIEGIKKILSMRTAKEFLKAICYLITFCCTCYLMVCNDLKVVLTLFRGDTHVLVSYSTTLILKAVFLFISLSILILLADFITEYFLHNKEIKMDRHEVKQEHKESDGNPQIKSARRRAHQDILSGEEKAAIRNSEVVMANPTHIAMAIYFKPDVVSYPFIAFRGTNRKAKAAIAYAEKIGIPVVRDIQLTRRLYHMYSQYSFISLNDDSLIEVMKILIWLRQIEISALEPVSDAGEITEGDASKQSQDLEMLT